MNPQPSEMTSQFLGLLFFIIAAISYITYKPKSYHNIDFFELGYIVDNNRENNVVKIKPTITKTKTSKPKNTTNSEKPQKQTVTMFQQDCINALISLGFGKKEAKKRMYEISEKYSPKTLQDFIQAAFKK